MGSHSFIKNKKNENIFVNINGELVKRKNAKISVFDSGFLLGDGVWEGIRLHKSKLVFIDEHIERLYNSAKGISLEIGMKRNDLINEIDKVIKANDMEDEVHIRLIITRGDKITPYQNPNANVGPINFVIIPEHKKTDPMIYKNGVVIGRVPIIRPPGNILSTHYNTLSKLNCILASIEANKLGFDEGIMDDPNGNISTCNSTNLFFINHGKVLTSKGEYCLNGITRGKAIEICNKNNIVCLEEDFTFDDIINCDEAFVTGTFAGIIPVSKIENRNLKSTNSDSLVNQIRILYNKYIQESIN